MSSRNKPDIESLTKKLRFLIDIHPIRPVRSPNITFIYMGLLEDYPGIVSYRDLNTISKRKKTPEQIAEAILLMWQRHETEV